MSQTRATLTSEDVEHGRALLRVLHRRPELSGQEEQTARLVQKELARAGADEVVTSVGRRIGRSDDGAEQNAGRGVLARFGSGDRTGVLLRCELDALPIEERTELEYRSEVPGRAHLCGHDGHMSILLTVARVLGRRERSAPVVWLLFQPAEETGAGARAVGSDPRFETLAIRHAYALHNLPGFPLGSVVMRSGTMCCASTGVDIELSGRAAHAAQPETGRSPARALAELMGELERRDDPPGSDFATVVGAELGERAFGTAPDTARLFVTLRSALDAGLAERLDTLREHVEAVARRDGLEVRVHCCDTFKATVNDASEVARIRDLVGTMDDLQWIEPAEPFRWSEDFGELLAGRSGALIGLGAGEETLPLHDPGYVFPDRLVERGATLLLRLLARLENGAN